MLNRAALRREALCILRYCLVTLAAEAVLLTLWYAVTRAAPADALRLTGYGQIFLSAVLLAYLHRTLAFRAKGMWMAAIPVLLCACFMWGWLPRYAAQTGLITLPPQEALPGIAAKSLVWLVISYLAQRLVLYPHTLDTNELAQRHRLPTKERTDPDE